MILCVYELVLHFIVKTLAFLVYVYVCVCVLRESGHKDRTLSFCMFFVHIHRGRGYIVRTLTLFVCLYVSV